MISILFSLSKLKNKGASFILIPAVFLSFSLSLFGQPGVSDPTFNTADIEPYNSTTPVVSSVIQPDGKIIIGGTFTSFNGTPRNGIARLNSNCYLDTDFNPGTGANNFITSVALQTDGKIIIAGNFTSYNGTTINRIARLNSDGALDPSFVTGNGANGFVYSATVQSDGKIIIVGDFTTYNGTSTNRIARLNPNGSLDATFNTGSGANVKIDIVKLQTDGKIIIAGNFTSYNGITENRIVRLNSDGSLDTAFSIGSGADGEINSVLIQPDGKIIIGGSFVTFNGITKNRITRLNSDGSLDTSFITGTGALGPVVSLELKSDGKIIIGGSFTSYNGTTKNRIAVLNSDGSLENSFSTIANGEVSCIVEQSSGNIIIGGGFSSINNQSRGGIAQLNSNGTLLSTFNFGTGANNSVFAISVQPDGKIVIGGDFTLFNHVSRGRIARLNTDGSLDNTFIPTYGADAIVWTTAIQQDGKILIGGEFIIGDGFGGAVQGIARLNTDGSIDTTFHAGSGVNNRVFKIALQSDGKIIIGGNFTSYNGTTKNRIARLNNNGSLDNNFTASIGNNEVQSILVHANGKITIGGTFTTVNTATRNRIVQLNTDGTTSSTFSVGTGANNTVSAIALQTDGKLIVAGNFTSYNGSTINRIVRLNSTGTIDASFNVGSGANSNINTLSILEDGKIIIGGSLSVFNGLPAINLARLNSNGTLDVNFNSGSGVNLYVSTTAIQDYGKILIGGSFNSYNGITRNGIARIFACQPTSSNVSISSCQSYTWINGTTYTSSGTYTHVLENNGGCDSVITLNLTILNSSTGIDAQTACDSLTWIDGITYTSSTNTPTFTIPNSVGCDSVVNLHLTILNSSTGIDAQTACDSLTWIDGITYSSSTNTPTFTLTNSNGCDSVVTLHLTILNSSTGVDIQSACDSFTWINGTTYNSSTNTPTFILPNSVGCDSVITLHLTILNDSTTDMQSACGSFTWINGTTYNSSTNTPTFTLTNSNGCDSVVTLHLTILGDSTLDIQSACDSFTWINGITYTSSTNTPTFTLTNSNGCDSVISLNLVINENQPITQNSFSLPSDVNSCNGDLAITLSGNGDFNIDIDNGTTILSSSGYSFIENLCPGTHDLLVTDFCGNSVTSTVVIPIDSNYIFNNPFIDSLAQDSIGITIENCDIYYAGIDTAYIDSIWSVSNTVNVIWNIVDSNGSNFDTTSYVLNNGNGVYLLQLTVFCSTKSLGDYFGVTDAIFFENGNISSAGISKQDLDHFVIYPNPTNNLAVISFNENNAQYNIYNTQGNLVQTSEIHPNETVSMEHLESGVYLFELVTSKTRAVQRIIKN